MLDIEANIYPPTLYALLDIIKKAEFKTAIYADGCGGPNSMQLWSDLVTLVNNKNSGYTDINALCDYWIPSNYGGTTCKKPPGSKECPAAIANACGNCAYTTVCDWKWLTDMGILKKNILPATNCGTWADDPHYLGNKSKPNLSNSTAATGSDYIQQAPSGWIEWIYNVDSKGGHADPTQVKVCGCRVDNCYKVWAVNDGSERCIACTNLTNS